MSLNRVGLRVLWEDTGEESRKASHRKPHWSYASKDV